MDRINESSAEADKFGAGKDGFTDGDPGNPGSATIINADFLDGVQEEIVSLIETSGQTPSGADYTQLAQAVLHKVSSLYTADVPIEFDGPGDTEARIFDDNSPTNERYVIMQFGPSNARIKVYFSGASIELAYNCEWITGTGWVSTGPVEGVIFLTPPDSSSLIKISRNLVSNVFTEAFHITGNTSLSPGAPLANALYPAALTKVVGTVRVNSGVISFSGYGIDDVEFGSGSVEVVFGTPFATTNYHTTITGTKNVPHIYYAIPLTTTNVGVFAHTTEAVPVDPTITDIDFVIDVKGIQ